MGEDSTTAITDIEMDNTLQPVSYYTMQGLQLSSAPTSPGFYIRRQGTQTSKVYIR